MKTALVAGAAGFIGSHLCDFLVAQNYRVIAVDNFVSGQRDNTTHWNERVEFIEADIRIPWTEWLKQADRVDEIYNLASPASPVDFEKMPTFILSTASEGHKNLLNLALHLKNKAQKNVPILFASTSEVYGDPLEHPQKEDYWGNVNPIGIRSCYDEAKRFGEAISMAYHREFGVPIKLARIFNTYGPRMRPTDGRVICNFLTQALSGEALSVYGDGSQTRSFCYVEDLVRGLFALMLSRETGPINLGNPNEVTVLQVAHSVCELVAIEPRIKFINLPPDDPKRRKPDIHRAQSLLNWAPKTDFHEGLAQTLRYFRNTLHKS